MARMTVQPLSNEMKQVVAANNTPFLHTDILKDARDVLEREATALNTIASQLGDNFVEAITLIRQIKGRLIISGIGKSGHIARKIAATLASTGQPSFLCTPPKQATATLG